MAQVFESLKLDFSFRPKFAEGPRETLVFGGPRSLGSRAFSWGRPFDGPWRLVKTSVSRGPSANFGQISVQSSFAASPPETLVFWRGGPTKTRASRGGVLP